MALKGMLKVPVSCWLALAVPVKLKVEVPSSNSTQWVVPLAQEVLVPVTVIPKASPCAPELGDSDEMTGTAAVTEKQLMQMPSLAPLQLPKLSS